VITRHNCTVSILSQRTPDGSKIVRTTKRLELYDSEKPGGSTTGGTKIVRTVKCLELDDLDPFGLFASDDFEGI